MDRSHPCLRLDIIITPTADITRLWNTFRPVDRLRDEEIRRKLQYGWEHGIRTTWLIDFIHIRSLNARGESYQRDACHGFLLLIFATILFPYSSNLIDGALTQVILQVVGGHSYVEAALAETIRSFDYVREIRRGGMRGSPHLLQIWLLVHIRPFGSSHPFSCITDERSLIARLLHVFQPSDPDYTDWIQFFEELTPTQFLWTTRWNPGGPMIIGCPSVIGLPLISHLGSTLIFPTQVIRQLSGLQDIPTEADRAPYRFIWADTTASLPDRFLRVREVRRLWDTRIVQELYFPEHPTDEEWAFSATAAYVVQFHPHELAPVRRLRIPRISQASQADIPDTDSSVQGMGESYQRDACHGFLLLIFGTILFPYSSNLIDGALTQVILQVVGGHSYVEAVLAETIRSFDYVREIRRGRMRGSPHLLQIWLLVHIRPFGSSHPFSCITDERSLIARLLHVFQPSDPDYTDWIQFFEELTPTQFLWTTRWNPGGPMIIGCPSVIGLPLISHLGSTLIFPTQVIRQLSGLQDIPTEADRAPYRFIWADTTASLPDRFLRIREVRRLWDTRIVQELYFPEHPTDEEWAFSATAAYVVQFHPHELAPVRRLRIPRISQASQADIPDTDSSVQGGMCTELQSIREERDRLRCELVDIRADLTDHREL
ncbi:hypothetical protein CRG98_012481 [Punica granatum]|uniref:DUF7745 domain-containing protein n=1 Tax=Punica granatum TaxID=22663 RepID=A0A2I0KG37_PUNGR|nr:hypothetical protein CRG98_012481 [Punica granatum]